MKRRTNFSIMVSKLFWWLSANENKKSYPMFKRSFVAHECKYTGEYMRQSGYAFIKCIHWGCFCYYPVDRSCDDYGQITKKEYLVKEINYYQNKIDNYNYTCGWSDFDNKLVDYMKSIVRSTRNDLIKMDSDVYYNQLMDSYKLPLDEQPVKDMEIWRSKYQELSSQMNFN